MACGHSVLSSLRCGRMVETTMIYIETREDEMRTAINLVG